MDKRPNECCNDPANIQPGAGPRGLQGALHEDESVVHCTVCHCRHYDLAVDPLEIGLIFGDI